MSYSADVDGQATTSRNLAVRVDTHRELTRDTVNFDPKRVEVRLRVPLHSPDLTAVSQSIEEEMKVDVMDEDSGYDLGDR